MSSRCGSLAAIAAVALACLATAAPAAGSAGQVTIVDATKEATGHYGERARRSAIADLDALGVDALRILVYWPDVVPQPHNSLRKPKGFRPRDSRSYLFGGAVWSAIDQTVRDATTRGIQVMLVPTGRFSPGMVPRWATRHPKRGTTDPRPRDYGDFLHAIGSRYNGHFDPDGRGPIGRIPAVSAIAVWNEPNSAHWLIPQFRNAAPYSPLLYRRLFEAARQSLESADWHGTLLAGETSTVGSAASTMPVEFMRQVLCLPPGFDGPPSCPPLGANGWAHHPYGFGIAPWQAREFPPGLVSIGSLGDLTGALAKAERAGAESLPLYVTEFGYESPPDPGGLPFEQQAEYMSIAEKIAYDNPRVASFAQYLMRDDPPYGGGFIAFESGLRLHRSKRSCARPRARCKPSWYAFRTPLAIRVSGETATIWGRVRPARASTTVTIFAEDTGGPLLALRDVTTDERGYFQLQDAAIPGRRWAVGYAGQIKPLIRGYNY